MLTFHDCTSKYTDITPDLASTALPPRIVWVDILDGSADEIAFVERATGFHVPTLAELSEIESSSRLRTDHGALYLSMPIVGRAGSNAPQTTSVGFILTRDLLITVRFAQLTAFTTFAQEFGKPGTISASSIGAFVGLMDAIIDRAADVLESVGAELDLISQRVFGTSMTASSMHQPPAREDASLRAILRKIGRSGDLASKIRDSLLGIGRIVPYAATMGSEWFPTELRPRMEAQRHDITSLSDYEAHLSGKVQFLLDATLGLINVEQNNIIKVLTIVSVVGVPPTLIASMYGMNFKHMPELDWAWGYPYGLTLIAISAVAPLLWFKIRGWL